MLRLFVFIFVSLLSLQCFGTEGCVVNGYLYPNKLGTSNGYDAYTTAGKITINPSECPRAMIIGSTGSYCAVLTSIWFPSIGIERYYNMVEACPIDDYVPFMLMIIGGFGLYVLKRKSNEISISITKKSKLHSKPSSVIL